MGCRVRGMTFLWLIMTCNTDWRHGPGCAGLITILVLRCWPGVIFIRMAEITLMPVASVSWCHHVQDVAPSDHSLWAPPSPNVWCLPVTGHRIAGSPPWVLTLITRHIPIPHSSLVTDCTRPMQPISCPPVPLPVLPPPLFSSSAAYTAHTMPIDPIQSHHPLPFKYFSVTQLNYCYLSPDLGTRYSSLALGCLSRCICMSGTRASVTAIAVTQPQMQRSHSSHAVWFSTNSQAVNSFQYSRV